MLVPAMRKSNTAPPPTDPVQLVCRAGSTGSVDSRTLSARVMPGRATSVADQRDADERRKQRRADNRMGAKAEHAVPRCVFSILREMSSAETVEIHSVVHRP